MIDFTLMYVLGFAMFIVWTKYFWASVPKNQETIVKAITDPESVQIKDAIPLIAMTLLSAIFVIILIVNFASLIFSKIF